jgi:hypothetical protein
MDKQQTAHTNDTAVFTNISGLDQPYEAPCIEVVEISVEKGFADSTTDFGEDVW